MMIVAEPETRSVPSGGGAGRRLAHAYPEGSLVALCGATGHKRLAGPNSEKCEECRRLATMKSFAAR